MHKHSTPLVLVCHPSLAEELNPLVQLREQQGWRVQWLSPAKVDTLAHTAASFVLLVGHPRAEGALHLPTCHHPPAYRFMTGPFHGDHALVHGSLQAPVRHAVGRLPARNPAQLRNLVERWTTPPGERARVAHLLDGDPQWGVVLARVCHALAGRMARTSLAPDVQI